MKTSHHNDTRFIVTGWFFRRAGICPALLLSEATALHEHTGVALFARCWPGLLALVLAAFVVAPTASATNSCFYPGSAVENFNDTANWTSCPPNRFVPACAIAPPGSGDNVFFYDGVGFLATYTMAFPLLGNITTGDVTVAGVDVTFNQGLPRIAVN